MAVIGIGQFAAQLVGVGEVAVVHHDDAKRCIHVKRLGFFFFRRTACRGVAHLTEACVARQRTHVTGAKYVAHHALGFVHEEFAPILGDDACGILTPVLQQQERVINQLIDGRGTDDTNNSTHSLVSTNDAGHLDPQ